MIVREPWGVPVGALVLVFQNPAPGFLVLAPLVPLLPVLSVLFLPDLIPVLLVLLLSDLIPMLPVPGSHQPLQAQPSWTELYTTDISVLFYTNIRI